MAGVRLGVSYSAVSAVGEADGDALINIEAEHAPGRCDNFPARMGVVRAPIWASVRCVSADSAAGKADALRFPSAPAFAAAADPAGHTGPI